MKILLLEDHAFYGDEIYEALCDAGHEVFYARNYKQGVEGVSKTKFDCSVLDIILQNGNTGLSFAKDFEDRLGRVFFVTGCEDSATLEAITNNPKYASATKGYNVYRSLKEFLDGGTPTIKQHPSSDSIPITRL